jgi:hypothetical protein
MEEIIEEILESCWKKSDSLEDTKKRAAKEITLLMLEEKKKQIDRIMNSEDYEFESWKIISEINKEIDSLKK